ncbi:MAG: sec-independent protein translocase protein TatC [Rikenellaceae bacterium]|nr:sec-independent protein translocase protein TatC [Rikenellaceae bacterium]
MQFWDHIEELRKRFFRIIIVVISLMLIVFSFKSFLFDTILFGPLNNNFITYQFICHFFPKSNICNFNYFIDLQNLTISGQFIKHISISFLISLFLAFPYIIWELWLFVKPGLYDYEKKSAIKILVNSILLFIIGTLFSYFIIIPLTINFFYNYQVSARVINQFTLDSYFTTFTTLLVLLGLVFELPIIIYFLIKFNIVSINTLKKQRKIIFLIILIIAAYITPGGDPISLTIMTAPLYLLFEFSLMIANNRLKHKKTNIL